MSWRARAVFVSGTFRDMHKERDLLADRAFPALEEQLALHFTTLERVDLRVGVETRGLADDHAKQHLVLKVCLEDVKRCRPFLVVLIGDRYGWVPPIDRARAATTEAGFDTALEGKSVTALEIEYGLWGDPDQQTRSRIYFRQLDYTGMDEAHAIVYSDERAAVSSLVSDEDRALAAIRAAALAASRDRLRNDRVLGPRCRNYPATWDPATNTVTGLGPFVAAVIKDLLPEMIAEAKEQVAAARAGTLPTPLQQFVAERARGFRGRATLVGDLCRFATDPAESAMRGRVVTGPSGGGKSAVFARVFEELAGRGGDEFFVLAHAAGIDPRSASVRALLEDWVAILAGKLGVENPLAAPVDGITSAGTAMVAREDTRPKPDEVFKDLLRRAAAKKRVVLLLDALDRFERTPEAQHLTWLPTPLPTNVRMVATAIPGTETDALSRRPDVFVEQLEALSEDDALEIAKSVYDRYHRQPSVDAVRQLVNKRAADGGPAHGNALWLVSALEELNLLDGDDFRRAETGGEGTDEDRLHAMVVGEAHAMPGEVEALYARIFERAGRRVSDDPQEGPALTRAFAVTIALSRTGFREKDLAALIPDVAHVLDPSASELRWDALSFASLRRALRAHLVRRGEDDRWDFHHRQARSAAERAYVPDGETRKQIHQLVANHLLGLDKTDPLHETETMVHLMQAADLHQAAAFYGGDLTEAESTGATATLATMVVDGHAAGVVASLLNQPLDASLRTGVGERFLFELSAALETRAPLEVRELLHHAAERCFSELAAADPGGARGQRNLSVCHDRLGDVLTAQGDLPGARVAFEVSLEIRERLVATDLGNAGWQRDLSMSHIRLGDVLTAQGSLSDALAAFQTTHRILERLAAADSSNASYQHDLSVSHIKLGDVLTAQGNLQEARTAYQASFAIAERLATADPGNAGWQRDLAVSHDKLGNVLTAQGNLPGALAAFQASLAIRERLAAADPGNAGWQRDLSVSHEEIGDELTAQGNLPGARAAFQASLTIRERLAAADPGNAGWQRNLAFGHDRIGDVLTAEGNLPGARTAFQASLAIRERLAVADPGNAAWQRDLAISHDRLGDVLTAQGNLLGAGTAFQASHRILEFLAAADPANAGWQRDLAISHDRLGDMLTAQGNLPGARVAFEVSLSIRERLAAADPGNADWQRNLSISHDRHGDVLTAQGNLPGARVAFQASLAIRERLAEADPGNARWQRDLSISHDRLGDVLTAQGNLPGARVAFQASLAIRGRLAEADPGNADWQRDLSISHDRLGDVLAAQGNLPGARVAFQGSLAIRERLAAADPGNTGWQRDLAISQEGLGDVLMAQGELPGARTAFQASLTIRERLAAADPGNTGWQRDLAFSLDRVGDVLTTEENLAGARAAFQASLTIRERLTAAHPGNVTWLRDLSVTHERLGDVLTAEGNLSSARVAFQASLTIAERLAAANPGNADWQRDLIVSNEKLASHLSQVQDPSAENYWRNCHSLLRRMKASGMFLDPPLMELFEQLERQ